MLHINNICKYTSFKCRIRLAISYNLNLNICTNKICGYTNKFYNYFSYYCKTLRKINHRFLVLCTLFGVKRIPTHVEHLNVIVVPIPNIIANLLQFVQLHKRYYAEKN